ncbi:mechanosensitive ion channel domain-containing protein [Vibrio sp.]|uniref:mechanosensitive ion channel domain-containing protein n=1 Tax=Vibrio sp. TaxID=678 RepID=UPI003D11DD5C
MSEYLNLTPVLYKLALAITLLILYGVLKRIASRAIVKLASSKQVNAARLSFVLRCFNIALLFVFASLFSISLDIGYGDISLFLSSIFAVLGVALFAQWSILSNVTASFLIFFVFPYRVGDRVRVLDKDDDIEGEMIDITMFHVIIRHNNGNIITYPNNLILQKGVVKITPEKKRSKPAKPRLYTRLVSRKKGLR